MKYQITKKQNSMTVFIDSNNLKTLSEIADLIEDNYPGSVLEVIHNRTARQGSIILKKGDYDFRNKINKLLTL